MSVTKVLTVNAERRSDAENAVLQECRKRGIRIRHVQSEWADFVTGQRPNDKVAIVVTKGQDGLVLRDDQRRTVLVTFEVLSPEATPS